ncbi:MAG: peroxide stress protein YaaA [Bacteroidetes bacterium]|nr:MAG: peroxide stress protein YaaA [Bacteroidota bacterium]
MIILLSPAKKLDYSPETAYTQQFSQPDFIDQTKELVKLLAEKNPDELSELMHISPKLAELNHERYQNFSLPFSPENARQALLAFKGDVYQSLSLQEYTPEDFDFAQAHLRILSGLYGLLRPLDLIQPYRLEMGTRMPNPRGKNLYEFWGDRIARAIGEAMEAAGTHELVNLASNEYFKAVNTKLISGRIITPVFKDERNGQLKTIFLFAKQARGHMADYAIRNRISQAEDLKGFDRMGYRYHESLSTPEKWVFTR